jgi:hypothetical protein
MLLRNKITLFFKKPDPPLQPVDENISKTDNSSNSLDKQYSRMKGDMFEEYIEPLFDRSNASTLVIG